MAGGNIQKEIPDCASGDRAELSDISSQQLKSYPKTSSPISCAKK
jgi:hypothetical protein